MNPNFKNLAAVVLGGAAFIFTSNPALASKDLARAKNCLACHSVDNQVVGPAYKDVAAKYAGREDAPATLIKKIREGGVGYALHKPHSCRLNFGGSRSAHPINGM